MVLVLQDLVRSNLKSHCCSLRKEIYPYFPGSLSRSRLDRLTVRLLSVGFIGLKFESPVGTLRFASEPALQHDRYASMEVLTQTNKNTQPYMVPSYR